MDKALSVDELKALIEAHTYPHPSGLTCCKCKTHYECDCWVDTMARELVIRRGRDEKSFSVSSARSALASALLNRATEMKGISAIDVLQDPVIVYLTRCLEELNQ